MGSPSQLHAAVRDALAEIPDGLTPEQRVGAVRALLERSRNAHRARRRINQLLESALEWAATAPRCPCDAVGRKDAAHPECSACEVFVCARCDRWVSWEEGAADETPHLCDGCWVAVQGLEEAGERVAARQRAYDEWISAYVARCGGPAATLGRCRAAAEEMARAFPELRVVRGHVYCPKPWGKRGHWWCVTEAGERVDPTAGQFTGGIDRYEEYRPGDEVRLGSCMDCGAELWGNPEKSRSNFCGSDCERRYAAYLTGGEL